MRACLGGLSCCRHQARPMPSKMLPYLQVGLTDRAHHNVETLCCCCLQMTDQYISKQAVACAALRRDVHQSQEQPVPSNVV